MKQMQLSLKLVIAFVITTLQLANAQSAYNKTDFYNAMANDNLQQIETQLKEAQTATGNDKAAILGTLTMKKAGLISGPGKKLKTFKAGHEQLEASITAEKNNAEYRFMRLMIQEHAPGILGYKDEIKNDSEYIRKSFKTLPKNVQDAIMNYARTKSKVLSAKDFN